MSDKKTNCIICGNEFIKKSSSHKLCSDECRGVYRYKSKEIASSRYTIFERDDFKCVYCGKSSIEDGVTLCIDHIDPYFKSRDNNIYNLITSCNVCNLDKSYRALRKDVYDRIVKRNKERTNGFISKESQKIISDTMDEYFTEMKIKNQE